MKHSSTWQLVHSFRFIMALSCLFSGNPCLSGGQQKKREMEEEYRNCYSHYQYACYLEKNENRREAYRFYMKAQGELEALQIHCFSVANDTFIENVELLLRCIHHRVPVCMGLCIDEMRNVRKHLKEVRNSGTSPSYKLKLADIETDLRWPAATDPFCATPQEALSDGNAGFTSPTPSSTTLPNQSLQGHDVCSTTLGSL